MLEIYGMTQGKLEKTGEEGCAKRATERRLITMNLLQLQPILVLQADIVWENKEANHLIWQRLLEQARPAPGTLVVLPEMAASGFTMNPAASAEGPERLSESVCARLAELWKVHLICGLVSESTEWWGRNQSVVFSPDGGEVARYTKMQLFTLGGEAQCHIPGDEIVVTTINGVRTALFICYDLRFPELFREAVRQGAELFVVIANWPAKRIDHWTTLLRARAIENQAWVVGVNRVGTDPSQIYSGQSIIVDCHGVIHADAGGEEGFASAQMDIEGQRKWRTDFPALQDRRFGTL